ncbi:MAG TPA: tol-pal system protein YbgF [Gammaproteobacteria bacterium]|nr:tol-pal system protein YbgF [Gammaproteobacteria bacterium]
MRERQTLRRLWAGATMVALLGAAGQALAQDKGAGDAGLEQRVARLERKLDSQGLVDMLSRIEQLQSDVQRLRGELEVQSHTIDELKQRQRDLYADIDRRLSQLERGAPVAGAAAPQNTGQGASAGGSGTVSSVSPGQGASAGASAAASGTGGSSPAKEQQAYQSAFDQLRELRYDQAIAAFRKFLKEYPHGRYAHIAQYWVAEANYAQRHFKAAIADYQKLLDDYPNSPKRAEAMLKIGYSYYELGDMDQAKTVLNNLLQAYPKTTESGQAQNLLQKIKLQSAKGK